MDWFTLTLTTLLSVFVGVYFIKWYKKRQKFIEMLDRIPGPRSWPIIGNIEALGLSTEDLLKTTHDFTKKYGDFFRVWTASIGGVIIARADYMETVLSSTEEIDKSIAYKFLEPWLGRGLLTGTGEKWHAHRKMFTPSFHFKILEQFVDIFNEKSQILVDKLKTITPGTEFDIYSSITLLTLDIICETAMGINMNTQVQSQENKNAEYISGIYALADATIVRIFKPWLYLDWVYYYLSSSGRRYKKVLKSLHDFTRKVVSEKKAARSINQGHIKGNTTEEDNVGIKKKQAFLDLLLEAAEGQEITDAEIRAEVDTFMFEGHDTTTVGISWSIFLLGNYPEIQERVVEELNNIFQGKKRKITTADLREMKYLEMVIKEALRLFPSVPFIGRLLKKDLQLGEYIVPAGSELRLQIYCLHRNPAYYENPNTFNPDNFLPEKVKERHPFSYIPFSAGPRNCIGQKFALFEEKTILATILLNYRIESVEKYEDITPVADLILRPKSGVRVKLYPRTLI